MKSNDKSPPLLLNSKFGKSWNLENKVQQLPCPILFTFKSIAQKQWTDIKYNALESFEKYINPRFSYSIRKTLS